LDSLADIAGGISKHVISNRVRYFIAILMELGIVIRLYDALLQGN